MKSISTDSKLLPKYESTDVRLNDDGTYNVKHIFVDSNGAKIIVKYPRVTISIDNSNPILEKHPKVFPFVCDVFADMNTKNLFVIEVENKIVDAEQEQQDYCATTGLLCSSCQPGPCDHRVYSDGDAIDVRKYYRRFSEQFCDP